MHVTVPELRIFLNLFVMNLFVMNFILHSVLLFDMRLLCGKYNSNFRELTWFLWIPWICNTAEHFISPRRWQIYCGHLWPPVCAQGLCAITSANCNMYKQIFTKAGAHLKTKRSSSPVPVQTQGSSCSHLTDTGPGAEVGLSPFFFLSNSCCLCLMRHQLFVSTELLRQSLKTAAELTLVMTADKAWKRL